VNEGKTWSIYTEGGDKKETRNSRGSKNKTEVRKTDIHDDIFDRMETRIENIPKCKFADDDSCSKTLFFIPGHFTDLFLQLFFF